MGLGVLVRAGVEDLPLRRCGTLTAAGFPNTKNTLESESDD